MKNVLHFQTKQPVGQVTVCYLSYKHYLLPVTCNLLPVCLLYSLWLVVLAIMIDMQSAHNLSSTQLNSVLRLPLFEFHFFCM